jgi:hypothetical protein
MKRFLTLIIVFIIYTDSLAQTESNIVLDSLHLTNRKADVNDNNPVSVFDTAFASRTVELNALFYIGNLWELDSIEIRYGTSPGLSDIIHLNLEHIVLDNSAYIRAGDIQIPVINGKVYFTYLIPETSLQESDHIWIRARDTQGRYSNILTDKN